jgi:hypothetical protein
MYFCFRVKNFAALLSQLKSCNYHESKMLKLIRSQFLIPSSLMTYLLIASLPLQLPNSLPIHLHFNILYASLDSYCSPPDITVLSRISYIFNHIVPRYAFFWSPSLLQSFFGPDIFPVFLRRGDRDISGPNKKYNEFFMCWAAWTFIYVSEEKCDSFRKKLSEVVDALNI